MATREADLDLGGDAPKKGGKKPWLMIGGGALALIAATIGGTVYLLGGKAEPADAKHAKAEKVVAPPVYTPLEPPFVVNFEDDGTIRFLQVSVEVSSRDPKVAEAIKLHMPAIRDQLIMLFSDVDYATLSSREGKDALRAKALDTVKGILKKQGGSSKIDGLYFTNFVMQ
ncbi:MAG: flagellar basal body-associated protein FliL [Immundisolibacter sp.]|uniref:flagellar basal body-associated FliL family protein n=1 Tax=Immundisolibacter sp. TaxID=1934948 RepID=UPI003D0B2A94